MKTIVNPFVPSRRLIVNADDLGLSVCVSRGIETAHRKGILSSATLMAGCPAFDEGVRVALDNPSLGVGVHLNIVRGHPVCPAAQVAGLLGENGLFGYSVAALGKAVQNPEILNQAEREYRAQIEKVLRAGITPTHLDFEKHHAVWKPLYGLCCRLAAEYGIPVRSLNEPVWRALLTLPWPGWDAVVASSKLRTYVTLRHRKFARMKKPDYFWGQTHIGHISEPFLLALLRSLPAGTSELMTHPGIYDAQEMQALSPVIGTSWIQENREQELAALCAESVQAAVGQCGVELINFSHL